MGVSAEMMKNSKFDSVDDDDGVDEGVALSRNSLVSEVFELPPFLPLALEDFVDLEAEAADFVTRMFGRTNSVGSFKIAISFCS
jgi:hypothetical protein